jgi:hypothetical protein
VKTAKVTGASELTSEKGTEKKTADESKNTAEDSGTARVKLTNTQALNSFNSLPESVRRMVMDADGEDRY